MRVKLDPRALSAGSWGRGWIIIKVTCPSPWHIAGTNYFLSNIEIRKRFQVRLKCERFVISVNHPWTKYNTVCCLFSGSIFPQTNWAMHHGIGHQERLKRERNEDWNEINFEVYKRKRAVSKKQVIYNRILGPLQGKSPPTQPSSTVHSLLTDRGSSGGSGGSYPTTAAVKFIDLLDVNFTEATSLTNSHTWTYRDNGLVSISSECVLRVMHDG